MFRSPASFAGGFLPIHAPSYPTFHPNHPALSSVRY